MYSQSGHEIWKQWVALVNDKDPTDDGVQGYLKFSVSIVGPDDRPVVHPDNEDSNALAGGAVDGKDLSSLVLVPPTVKMKRMWLVIHVHHAEHLPKMDGGGLGMGLLAVGGTDAYVTGKFGDMKAFRSKVVTVKGTSRAVLNPQFNQELWIPANFPAMSKHIHLSVMVRKHPFHHHFKSMRR